MTKNSFPVIVWFRQDLRIRDNPALLAAHQTGRPIVPVFILDDTNSGEWKLGAASRWWLHETLKALDKTLDNKLCLQVGSAYKVIQDIIKGSGVNAIFWNRCYEPWRIVRDASLQDSLTEEGIDVHTFNGSLLFEPQSGTASGTHCAHRGGMV